MEGTLRPGFVNAKGATAQVYAALAEQEYDIPVRQLEKVMTCSWFRFKKSKKCHAYHEENAVKANILGT